MFPLKSILLSGFSLLVFSACGKPEVRTESLPGLGLTDYKTFSWAPAKQLEQPDNFSSRRDDLLDHQIKAQVGSYLASHGLKENDTHPDLKIAYTVRTHEQTEVSPGYFPEPFYSYWSDQPATRVITKNKGSVALDLIDAKSGKLVWRGIGVTDVGDAGIKNDQVKEAVAGILQKLPGRTETG